MPGLITEMEAPAVSTVKVPEYGFIVAHEKVWLDVDFATQSLKGRCEITILPQTRDLKTIRLDARQCRIHDEAVRVNGKVVEHDYEDPMLGMDIPEYIQWTASQHHLQRNRLAAMDRTKDLRGDGALVISMPKGFRIEEVDPFSEAGPLAVQRAVGGAVPRASSIAIDGNPVSAAPTMTPKTAAEQSSRFQPVVISIEFETTHFRDGLQFVGMSEGDSRFPHVYTKHSMDPGPAQCIFPCVDDPAMRCNWEVTIKCSRTLGDALKRPPVVHRKGSHHLLAKKGLLPNGHAHPVVEEYEVPLSEDEKLLEMTVLGPGEMSNETTDLEDGSKKSVLFTVTNMAPNHIGFAIGPFEQVDLNDFREVTDDDKLGQGNTRPVFGYCVPGRAEEVRTACYTLAHALDMFQLDFGTQYPFTEGHFVFVDDQVQDVQDVAGLSICSSRLLYTEDIINPEVENTRILVNAVATQWIGVTIVPQLRSDRWVTIGLAQFMTDNFMKSLVGHNQYAFRHKALSDKLVKLDVERPSIHSLGEILHLGAYEMDFMKLKSELVMFILDRRIIKASGSAGLIRVISKLCSGVRIGDASDSVISTESFRRLCEKVTKYRQTENFWNNWVLGAGCPKFNITQKFNKKRLCVEMVIAQKQEPPNPNAPPRPLDKASFEREWKEDVYGVYAGEVQTLFTGPMTIRIHEADGTPYEHIVEIREGVSKIEIPYNTKYKRLKRSKRQKERQTLNLGVADEDGGGHEALYYSLGDCLTSPEDMKEWGLRDWDQETEARMDMESYEWIRVDADFEWLCEKQFISMPAYMYVSQLQQDRDVVAQQDSILFLSNMPAHPLVATFLVRTLMDTRYYHGIRTMAAAALKTHANPSIQWIGFHHLRKTYQHFFCLPDKTPRHNDFSDKEAYEVELAIITAISKIRDTQGRCPQDAREFLLEILRFNDNNNNEYSDVYKIANLLSALAESLIVVKDDSNVLNDVEISDEEHHEMEEFKKTVIDELDRYRRMDEWINSYQNLFTVTVLNCKQRLMKHKVIDLDPVEFATYLHDGNSDHIRIKCFEALIDLGYIKNNGIVALLINFLSTDPSPYTRAHLFHVLALGLASVAFGESTPANPKAKPNGLANGEASVLDGGSAMDLDGEVDGLIVQKDDDVSVDMIARQAQIKRTTSIEGALAALREELKDNSVLKTALWEGVKSTTTSLGEQMDLLDVCLILYEGVNSMIVKMPKPRFWKVKHLGKGLLRFKARSKFRVKPLKAMRVKEPEPVPEPVPVFVPAPMQPPPPEPKPPQQTFRLSISSNPSKTPSSSLANSRASTPSSGTIKLSTGGGTLKIPTSKPPKVSPPPTETIKVVTPASHGNLMRPPKRPYVPERTPSSDERPRKIIKLRVRNVERVVDILSRPPNPAPPRAKSSTKSASPAPRGSSLVPGNRFTSSSPAPSSSSGSVPPKPARKPLPDTVRKPLPDSGSGSARKPLPDSGRKLLPDTVRKPLPDTVRKSLPDTGRKPLPEASPSSVTVQPAAQRPKLIIKMKVGKLAAEAAAARAASQASQPPTSLPPPSLPHTS